MIEIPATVIRADQMLPVVDFTSIGTNDLTQYTIAVDRVDDELTLLLDAWRPAVLQMIKFTCEGGRATGKPAGMCGEAGGDPPLALVLTGLSVVSLSMTPSKARVVRAGLHMHDLTIYQQIVAFTVDVPTPEEGCNNVLKLVAPTMQALL